MKIAITGGSGGVGRAVTKEALNAGHSVVSIDRVMPEDQSEQENLVFKTADATHYEGLVEAFEGCDALVHLAAIPAPGRHPDHVIHNNNVVSSYNALRAAVENNIMRICQASSVNAIGLAFSRTPRFDYFPIDENHPNYDEEPYSLSKWICEKQADCFARRYEDIRISSMRLHWVVQDRAFASNSYDTTNPLSRAHHLWAYTRSDCAARACVMSLDADFRGHEVFYIVAPDTTSETPSLDLAAQHLPDVPITGDLSGQKSFFSSAKAERLLGWVHK